MNAKPAQRRLKTSFWLDIALLASVCVLQDVDATGLFVHEWLGIAIVGMVFAHLLLSWGWIATQSRRVLAPQTVRSRINYLLNLGLFAAVTAVIFSGILISQLAVPALTGAKAAADMDWRWDSLHHQFSQWVIFLSGLHLAINWEWMLGALQKILLPFADTLQERLRRIREGSL